MLLLLPLRHTDGCTVALFEPLPAAICETIVSFLRLRERHPLGSLRGMPTPFKIWPAKYIVAAAQPYEIFF